MLTDINDKMQEVPFFSLSFVQYVKSKKSDLQHSKDNTSMSSLGLICSTGVGQYCLIVTLYVCSKQLLLLF